MYIKTDDIYKDIEEDVESKFHTSKERNKAAIGVMKNEFVGIKAKTYSYLTDDGSEDKKAKKVDTKK